MRADQGHISQTPPHKRAFAVHTHTQDIGSTHAHTRNLLLAGLAQAFKEKPSQKCDVGKKALHSALQILVRLRVWSGDEDGGGRGGVRGEAGRKRLGRRLLAYIGVEYNQVLYVLCVCIRFGAFPSRKDYTCSFDCHVMHGVLVFMECIDGALLW